MWFAAEMKAAKERGEEVHATSHFFHELGQMLKSNWLTCILAVCLMTG